MSDGQLYIWTSGKKYNLPNLPKPCLMLVTEPSARLTEVVSEAVAGGVNAVQWREKRGIGMGFNRVYSDLCAITKEAVPLIVNGDWQRSLRLRVRNIHLPEKSMPVGVVRNALGDRTLIGKSAHSVEAAISASVQGADYILVGTIFASSSHPDIEASGPEFLEELCQAVSVPVIAIGGITPQNAAICMAAGASGIAVLSGITRADDPRAIARAYWEALSDR